MPMVVNLDSVFRFHAFFLCITFSFIIKSSAQTCSPDIFSILYQGKAALVIHKTIETPQQDILTAGSALRINSGLNFETWDGYLQKLSPRGTILWAKRYMPPGYNTGAFYSVVMATDSSYFVTGRFGYLKRRISDDEVEELYNMVVLLHIDKFGNLVWMKSLKQFLTYYVYINNIIMSADGDYVLAASIYGLNYQRTLVFRMDDNGTIIWSQLFYSDEMSLGSARLNQLRNGTIALTGSAFKNNSDYSIFYKEGYYILTLDYHSGARILNKGYFFSNSPKSEYFPFETIKHISEAQDGSIYMYAAYSLGPHLLPPGIDKSVVIVTTPNGNLIKAIAYYNNQPGCTMLDAAGPDTHDDQLMLMDDGIQTILLKADRNGNMIWQKAYGNIDGNLKGSAILNGQPDKRILLGGRTSVAMAGLLKAEANWDMPCTETALNMTRVDVSVEFITEDINMTVVPAEKDLFVQVLGGINRTSYTFDVTTTCLQTCCNNIHSDTSLINKCDVSGYRLPDNSFIRESGMYYTMHKTSTGCDSSAFYNISLNRTPVIDLGPDNCLNGRDSIQLKVDSSYTQYNWMGLQTNHHYYTVTRPGIYRVSVTNNCGTTTDQVEILDQCAFEIFIPTAFSPNNDGLNDFFGLPPQNKNRLISLTVCNRWGQKLFETRNPDTRWDGRFRGILQPVGVYIYFLEMETLDKKKILKSGTISLIR